MKLPRADGIFFKNALMENQSNGDVKAFDKQIKIDDDTVQEVKITLA